MCLQGRCARKHGMLAFSTHVSFVDSDLRVGIMDKISMNVDGIDEVSMGVTIRAHYQALD